MRKPPATVAPHRTAMQGEIRQLKDKSCAALPNPGINSKRTAQRSRVQHMTHRTTLRRVPFWETADRKKAATGQCWQSSLQTQRNNKASSSQISVEDLIELLTLPPANRQLMSAGKKNSGSRSVNNVFHVDEITFVW